MTDACFNSKRAGAAGASEAHNTRAWTDDHPAPKYVTDFARYADPRGNLSGGQGLTRDQVRQEYIDHTGYGRRTGKVHNRAVLFREAVINCTAATEKVDVEQLVKRLEKDLNIRSMGWHLHRDEGHVDKDTGEPKHNYHIHLEYTNLKDGQVTDMNKIRMKRAQDICAEVLNMPRGKPHEETGRVSMDHKQYRQHARKLEAEKKKTRKASKRTEKAERRAGELEENLAAEQQARQDETARADQAETDRDRHKAEYEKLGQLNKDIRAEMKATEQAQREDYQKWKAELNDKEKSFQEKEAAGQQLIDELRARVKSAEQDRDQEKARADELDQALTDEREARLRIEAERQQLIDQVLEWTKTAERRRNQAETAEQDRDKEKARADRAEAQPQMIMGAVPFNITKIKLPEAGILQSAGSYREKAQELVDRAMQDRKHQMQKLAEDAGRNEVAAELNQARRKNETAAAQNAALESELKTEKLNTEAVKTDLRNTRERNRDLDNQVAVLKGENKKLDEEYTAVCELFEPIIILLNKLRGKKVKKESLLIRMAGFGAMEVNKDLRKAGEPEIEWPRTQQAETAEQDSDNEMFKSLKKQMGRFLKYHQVLTQQGDNPRPALEKLGTWAKDIIEFAEERANQILGTRQSSQEYDDR